ncbi:MAG TPA: nucleotidyltransferase domain-containing protein [bacterium]|nr:nucleotidyltransferase domain-containing protein [bacterium]
MLNVPEEELRRLCGRWGIRELSLFGSVLRGESGPESDVDLLVEFEDNIPITLLDFVNIRYELVRLFNRKVDLISKRGLLNSGNAMRREEILNTARTIYEKA